MAQKRGQHVMPVHGRWKVLRAGATRASGTFNTRMEAIARGRALARAQETELYIHGTDGLIRAREVFFEEPQAEAG